uniref:Lipid storage droplets surface-binding protein 1 n=1 Tax=Aceria tosichella TaxID=561515 RepID=A0A6G1SQ36_9ACAR
MENQNHQKKSGKKSEQALVKTTIVDRVYRYPMINMAITLGYTQYDKLKSSNVTVGEVMTKAESLAAYFWKKVSPFVERFQEPISKVDKLACDTLDFVEEKVNQVAMRA